jgi:hypothetical protein
MRYYKNKNIPILYIVFGVAVLLVIATIIILGRLRTDSVSLSSYMKIRKEMTKAEVFALLGPPSENDELLIPFQGTQPPPYFQSDLPGLQELIFASWRNWVTTACTVVIFFDEEDKVIGKGFVEHTQNRT